MRSKRFKNEAAFSRWLAKELRSVYGDKILVDVNTETGYGANGRSDFTVCFCGAFIAIELKQEGKELTPLQQQYAERVSRAGGWALAPMWPSKVEDLFGLLDFIEDLARRNKRQADKNYRETLESMKEAGEVVPVEDTLPAPANETEEDDGDDTNGNAAP